MSNELMKSNYHDIEPWAKAMVQSGYFKDVQTLSKAIVKIIAGEELGLGKFASMNGIQIIKGNTALSANLMASLVKSSGVYNYRVIELNMEKCILEFQENGQVIGLSEFTIKDAQNAGLMIKDVWKQYPRNLLFARAMSNGVKWFCPDVTNGIRVYTPEELENIPDSNEVVDASFSDKNEEPENPEADIQLTEIEAPKSETIQEKAELDESPEPVQEEVELDESPEPVQDYSKLTLFEMPDNYEEAFLIFGSDKKMYGECSDRELKGKMLGIVKKLNSKDYSKEPKSNLDAKRKAILLIQEFRSKTKSGEEPEQTEDGMPF